MDHRMRPILAHLVLLLLSQCIHAFIPGADGPVSNQEGLEGGNTTLLCDTSPEQSGDELMLLVWYKNNAPVYSFDARAASEWSSEVFNESSRVLINRSQQPTELTITNLREDDEALYHCRVDLLQSQTRNLGVNLTVVVLPSQPFFLDEVGNKVENKIGPYHEGDTLVISCLVIGGRPPPRISWYSGSTLVDASDGASDIPGVKENELYLPLTREHSGVLSCRASNTVLKEPVVSSLLVELFLPAQNVSILWLEGADSDEALQVGRPAVVQCVAEGSHPAPDLSWWLDHQHLTQHSNQTWLNSTNTAVSHLQLTPSVADNGATLSCIATNVAMAPSRGSKADVITLNVTYSPIVEVVKVGNGKLNEVVELDTLHLVCEIRANPPVDRIMWYFDDNKIMPGGLWGDNTSLASLVVEEALRTHAGAYSCAAGNSVGETRASHLSVTVLYPPQCSRKGITISQETIHCDVNALPPPDTYFWHMKPDGLDTQHLTTGSAILPLDQITGPLAGTLHVVCEAGNGIASQEKACEKNLSLEYLRPPQPRQCDLAFEYEEFQMRCIPVENASYYEVSVWRMSSSNTSLVLARRGAMGWGAGGRAQAARGGVGGAGAQAQGVAGGWLVRGGLGMLREGDEAGSAACNRFGCSRALLLRPTEKLLRASVPPWWNFFLERDVSLFLGAIVVVCVFVLSTWLAVHLARRSREKTPAQVIQLLRREVATEYMEHKRHAGCSARSCSSGYSGCSLDSEPPPPPLAPLGDRLHPPAPLVERHRKPMYYWEPPPDVTLTLTRESAV